MLLRRSSTKKPAASVLRPLAFALQRPRRDMLEDIISTKPRGVPNSTRDTCLAPFLFRTGTFINDASLYRKPQYHHHRFKSHRYRPQRLTPPSTMTSPSQTPYIKTSSDQTPKTSSDQAPADQEVPPAQPDTRWGIVFLTYSSSIGTLFNIGITLTDTLGPVMPRIKKQYQSNPPASWLLRLVSKVVVERATVLTTSINSGDDIEDQRVQIGTNTKDEELTAAFRHPDRFNAAPVLGAPGFEVFSGAVTTPRTVVVCRTRVDKKRLFWMLAGVMFGTLILAGVVAGLVSSVGSTCVVIGVLMGLFCLFVAVAAWLWRV